MAFSATTAANNAAGTYEHFDVTPHTGALGAVVTGVDLREMPDDAFAELRTAIGDHLVLFVRGQSLTPDQLEGFTRRWGEHGDDPFVAGMPDHPNIVRLLKEADEKVPAVFGGAWHSDWSFQETPPAYTLLYGVDIPAYGGDTLWANMHLVYEHLSAPLQAWCDRLRAVHSPAAGYGPGAAHNQFIENMEILWGPDAEIERSQPLVRVHPDSGRKGIYASPGYTVRIEGLHRAESDALLAHLHEVASAPAYTCRFQWRPGDLVIWDNRATNHLPISDYLGQRRELWRTTVRGGPVVGGQGT
ncbi:MAG: TauD/TfdA family dioxygenase [Acidimicrobiales bacterium]|nr:TauD/TfdA family dioxygenase [Acidimicrobiales bacterium]